MVNVFLPPRTAKRRRELVGLTNPAIAALSGRSHVRACVFAEILGK